MVIPVVIAGMLVGEEIGEQQNQHHDCHEYDGPHCKFRSSWLLSAHKRIHPFPTATLKSIQQSVYSEPWSPEYRTPPSRMPTVALLHQRAGHFDRFGVGRKGVDRPGQRGSGYPCVNSQRQLVHHFSGSG